MKLTSWIVIIITILVVAALTVRVDAWATEWKDIFFYIDRWELWVVVVIAAWVAKEIITWAWKAEVRLLK
jgi:hypothetical protein